MKTLLLVLCLVSSLVSAQTSAQLAADLQAVDSAHMPAINALLVAQRTELTAVHVAGLADAAADFKAASAERDAAVAKFNDLQTQITAVLTSTLTDLEPQLQVAQDALKAELTSGEGPQAAAKRLIVVDLQARVDVLKTLQATSMKSDLQKAVETAEASAQAAKEAKEAADKALLDAKAALNQ